MGKRESKSRDQGGKQSKSEQPSTDHRQLKQDPISDKAHRHFSEIDRREGEMDHGETGGNFREVQKEE